jgi:hypothetical protein
VFCCRGSDLYRCMMCPCTCGRRSPPKAGQSNFHVLRKNWVRTGCTTAPLCTPSWCRVIDGSVGPSTPLLARLPFGEGAQSCL